MHAAHPLQDRRRGGWLGNLDRVLLYSEPVAVGWGEFLGRVRLTVQSTRAVKIDDATFEAARQALGDDRQLFELVTVIAAYNMVSRILVAFDIPPETDAMETAATAQLHGITQPAGDTRVLT